MTTSVTAKRIVELFNSLEARNPERVRALEPFYHPDVYFQDPLQVQRGIADFLKAMHAFVNMAKEMRFDITDVVENDGILFLAWDLQMKPRLPLSVTVTIEGVSHLRLEDSLIIYHRDHWDVPSMVASAIPAGTMLYRKLTQTLV